MKKIQPVLTCGWTGYVKPTLKILEEQFEILDPIFAPIPQSLDYWYMLKTFRLPKSAWRREWKRWTEEMPIAFKARTAVCQKELEKRAGSYDLVYLSGTLHSLGKWTDKSNTVLMNDSTRKLSSSNANDSQRHFPSKALADEWFKLEGDVFNHCSAVIVGCERVLNSMTRDYNVDPKVIHNCGFLAGLNHSNSGKEKRFDGQTILYVGKGDFEKKGGYFLIEAFKKVREAVPEARLIVAGQNQEFDVAGVTSVGFVKDRDELRNLFEQAHVFALPSYIDRNPLTLVEAMSAATPVIATTYGAMPEIVGDAGYTVEPGNIEELASRLVELLKNKTHAERLGLNGRKRYEQIYSDKIVGERILEVFRQVAYS